MLGLQGRSRTLALLYAHCGITSNTSLTDVQGVQDATVVLLGVASAWRRCLLLLLSAVARALAWGHQTFELVLPVGARARATICRRARLWLGCS